MGTHPKHPTCPGCGFALYKTPDKGQPSKKGAPWKFCRNARCVLRRAPGQPELLSFNGGKSAKTKAKARAKAAAKRASVAPGEPEPIAKARARIKKLVGSLVPEGTEAASVGIVLALLSQETGNQEAANHLIEQYGLTQRFGIQKVEAG